MNRTQNNKPFMNDFAFYKSRFISKQKEIKQKLKEFSTMVDRFEQSNAYSDKY